MHILEFKAYYEPEIAAGIKLDADTAEALAAKGHRAEVSAKNYQKVHPKQS